MFQTNGTKDGVFFEDTGGSNQEKDFWRKMEQYSVLGVFLVSKPLYEPILPRY
jgi:hypothetical protein